MLKTVESFETEMKNVGLKYRQPVEGNNGDCVVNCGIKGKYTAYETVFIFSPDEHTISIQAINLLSIPIDRRFEILELINTLTGEYRWIKFCIDQENFLRIQLDAVVNPETCGKIAVELLLRTMKIIDDVYPKFMKAVWAD